MKAIKIILVVVVIAAIGFGVKTWVQNMKPPKQVEVAQNQFTAKIKNEIKELSLRSTQSFCTNYYREVSLHINDFYQQHKLSSNDLENKQWKENLEKALYATYTNKFIQQAFFVLENNDWRPDDLRLISREVNELKKSTQLISGSSVATSFNTIERALDKYYEITRFISSCWYFRYRTNYDLTDRFPIRSVRDKINRTRTLRRQHLENKYVNNCSRLHQKLREIPQRLFRVHVRYLQHKIREFTGIFSEYASHKEYYDNLFSPIEAEIQDLDFNSYGIGYTSGRREYTRLLEMWRNDNRNAYNYEYNTDTDEE